MASNRSKKKWDRYSSAGGVGFGTFAIWVTRYIHSEFWTDWITLLSPTLIYFSAILFLRLDQYFLYMQFKRYVRSTKKHLLEKIGDGNISEDKRKRYKEEYHSICDLEVEEFKSKVYHSSSVKKGNWSFMSFTGKTAWTTDSQIFYKPLSQKPDQCLIVVLRS